jgi:Flp pilus assembly protein TadG
MKNKNSERGQSLVELAVSLVILLYLLSGAVEFGIIFFQYVQLRDAAQEGALFGSMGPTGDIESRVRAASNKPIDLSNADPSNPLYVKIEVTATDKLTGLAETVDKACEGDALTVTVSFDHKVFMPFMSTFIGPTRTLVASVTDTVLTPPQTASTCH